MGTQRTREDSESGTGGAGDRMKTEELTKIEGEDTGLNTQEWFTKDTQVLKKTKTGSGESQLDRWGCNCKIKQDLNKPITQTVTLSFVRLTSCQTIGQNLTVVSAAWKSIGDLRSWLFQTKKRKACDHLCLVFLTEYFLRSRSKPRLAYLPAAQHLAASLRPPTAPQPSLPVQ